MKTQSLELYAIMDTSKEGLRFCYADEKKTKGAMALYDKKPKIEAKWKPFKKIVKVSVSIL